MKKIIQGDKKMKKYKNIILCLIMFIAIFFTNQASLIAQEFTFVGGTDQPVGEHAVYQTQKLMAEKLEAMSQGRIKMNVYTDAQLGDEIASLESLQIGAQDFLTAQFSNLATFVPVYGFFSLSYLFEDYEHCFNVIQDPEFNRLIQEEMEKANVGLKLLTPTISAARYLYTRNRPINSVEDLSGCKIRVMAAPTESKAWSAMGAMPVPMASSEIYTAIQQRVIDGAESGIQVIYAKKFYEVAPYINLTRHQFSIAGIVMSKINWDKLPADVQEMVQIAANEAAMEASKITMVNDDKYIDLLSKEPNVQIIQTDTTGFIERVKPLHEEIAKELKAEEFLKIIRKYSKIK